MTYLLVVFLLGQPIASSEYSKVSECTEDATTFVAAHPKSRAVCTNQETGEIVFDSDVI